MKTIQKTMSISCSPARLWELFFDEAYMRGLYLEGLRFKDFRAIELKEPTRKLAIKPAMSLPGPVERLIGDSFRYEEHGTLDRANGVWTWAMVQPPEVKQKPVVTTRGTVRVVADGEGRCRRTDQVEIEARIFGLGGLIESSVEKEIEKTWVKELAFIEAWITRTAS